MADAPEWLIIANGEPLPAAMLQHLAKHKMVMALDGSLATVLHSGLQPQLVLGDFDSVDRQQMKAQLPICQWQYEPDQSMTDLEKGLVYLNKIGIQQVVITQALGQRLDHSLYNLRLLKKFHRLFNSLKIISEYEQVCYVENQIITLRTSDYPQRLSLLAFTEAEVSSKGLEYEMHALRLRFAEQESISNTLINNHGQLEIKGGCLLLSSLYIECFVSEPRK